MEDRVDFHALWQVQLIRRSSNSVKYSEWSDLLMIKLLRRSLCTDIPSGQLDFVSHSIAWWWLSPAICEFFHACLGEGELVLQELLNVVHFRGQVLIQWAGPSKSIIVQSRSIEAHTGLKSSISKEGTNSSSCRRQGICGEFSYAKPLCLIIL